MGAQGKMHPSRNMAMSNCEKKRKRSMDVVVSEIVPQQG